MEKIKNSTKRCMPKYQYNKIRTLPKGGILVFPDSIKDLNGFLTDWPKDSFGGKINVHLPESKDTRSTLCINNFDVDRDIAEIGEKRKKKGFIYNDLSRVKNHKGESKYVLN